MGWSERVASLECTRWRLEPNCRFVGQYASGLDTEGAPANLMRKRPHNLKDGASPWPAIIDCSPHGLTMGATSLSPFVIVVYGAGDGTLGQQCNYSIYGDCKFVFRARSTAFATLIFQISMYAFELKSLDCSMFALTPGKAFYKDLWENKVLFDSIVGGMISVVVPIYAPGFNTQVF